MAQTELFLVLYFLANISPASAEDTCTWPKYFDISIDNGSKAEELEINSWETNIKIKKKDLRINGYMKQNMWLTVLTNNTVEVTYDTKKRDLENRLRLLYFCLKELEDSTYVVKVTRGHMDENDTFTERGRPEYMCVQFIQRSPFVLQWRVGPKTEEISDCGSAFAPIKPWPLIYLPVRKMPEWQSLQKQQRHSAELWKQYQSCPDLGGYQIRIYDKDGKAVNGNCKNDDPSPRLEFECVYGDGVRITQTQSCKAYSVLDLGSKLYCLATWEEGRYQFSVLVPSYQSGINSFHCLRLNKEDPMKEPAILFLDTICGKGELVKTKVNNFQLELRKTPLTSVCDDTSDQCGPEQCNSTVHSCLTTCNTCPVNDTIAIDESIHGVWVFQLGGVERRLNITENSIELFDIGIFHAYNSSFSETEGCLHDALTAGENEVVLKYLLGGVPKNSGCGPRVTTLRAKKISDAVLLVQIPAPAPLRANIDNSVLDHWCRNNYNDISAFGQLFRPVYPFQAVTGVFQNNSGYLTLVNEASKEPVECMFEDQIKDVTVTASLRSKTGYQLCQGSIMTVGEEKMWRLQLTCSDDNSTDITFSCLGRHGIDTEHYALILEASEKTSVGSLPLDQDYYCLILPVNAAQNSTIIFQNAGECDIVFKSLAVNDILQPTLTLTVGSDASKVSYALWLFYPMLICIYQLIM